MTINTARVRRGMHLQKPLVAALVGLSTKIHAVVDALGNSLSFHLTPGQACHLDGADQLSPNIVTNTVLADKGYDADERVIERLQAQGKTALSPAKRTVITLVTTTAIYTKLVISLKSFLPSSSSTERSQRAMTNALPTF